jgi:site-specific recombinase XerD
LEYYCKSNNLTGTQYIIKKEAGFMRLEEVIILYERHLRLLNRSETTIKDYIVDIIFFKKWIEKTKNHEANIEDINYKEYMDFLNHLKIERKYASASLRRINTCMISFSRFLYKNNYLKEDISILIEPIKVKYKEREFLNHEEALDFIENIDHEVIKIIAFTMYYAGLRVGECIKLENEHMDFEKRFIFIKDGKGDVSRYVPINDRLYGILKEYKSNKIESIYFFATKKTGRISKVRIDAVIKETRIKLNIDKQISSHNFRHSFSSNLVSKGTNIVTIQKLLGHKDVRTTSLYLHVELNELHKEVNKLE